MIPLTRWAATGPDPPTGQLRKTGLDPAVRLFVCIDRRLQLRATTIRERRDEWIKAGIFVQLKQIALDSYDRIAGLVLRELAVDGWHVERTNAWHNSFNRLQRCYERREEVIDAFFDLADAIITVRSLIRQAWTTYWWDNCPARRP